MPLLPSIKMAELLQDRGVKWLEVSGRVSFRMAMSAQNEKDLELRVREQMARDMAGTFAVDVVQHAEWERMLDTFGDALQVRMIAYVLPRRKLLDLLQDAYTMGRIEGARVENVMPR